MLVLARKIEEVIRIGDDVAVKIVGFKGEKVLLGITAPEGVSVDREEIYHNKQINGANGKEARGTA